MAEIASFERTSLNGVSSRISSSDDIPASIEAIAPILITVYIVVILLISGLSQTRVEETAAPMSTTAVSDRIGDTLGTN